METKFPRGPGMVTGTTEVQALEINSFLSLLRRHWCIAFYKTLRTEFFETDFCVITVNSLSIKSLLDIYGDKFIVTETDSNGQWNKWLSKNLVFSISISKIYKQFILCPKLYTNSWPIKFLHVKR